jgi:hypothetical protein
MSNSNLKKPAIVRLFTGTIIGFKPLNLPNFLVAATVLYHHWHVFSQGAYSVKLKYEAGSKTIALSQDMHWR